MAIQWYPGHMHKAKKAIMERLKSVDMVIEVLDARLPASSANPLLAKLSADKPKLKILNKQDLADAQRTDLWLAEYQAQSQTQAIALDASDRQAAAKLIAACRALVPHRKGLDKPLRVLICGIPNVGKSTLINGMLGKKGAKTGNEPGITKAEQRLILADDFWLYDTPGMLWPKIIVEEAGYHLAASGAVGRNALDEETVALELLDYLRRHYLTLLQARYQADLSTSPHWRDDEWLDWIGRKRGALLTGGRIDYQKAAERVLTDFRDGQIGCITLETPNQWAVWLKAGQQREAVLKAEREARKAQRSGAPMTEQAPLSADAFIEAALLTRDEALDERALRALFEPPMSADKLIDVLAVLKSRWQGRGLLLVHTPEGWRFQVVPAAFSRLSRLNEQRAPRYSRAVMETLAIIAYQQPVTRADIEAIRGVAVSSHVMQILQDRNWIEVIGQRDTLGQPNLWATTPQFLSDLQLEDLCQLPPLTELGELVLPELTEPAAALPAAEEPSDDELGA